MHRIALALFFTLTLLASPARVHAAPPDTAASPPPAATAISFQCGQVVGTWVVVGDVVFAHYVNRTTGEQAECAWDRRTREVLYGRNLGVIRCGE